MSKYDWITIQKYYDAGHTFRDITREFGPANRTIVAAVTKGLLLSRGMRHRVNRPLKYDWSEVQKKYDDGHSWRHLLEVFGMSSQALKNARDRGDLVTWRSKSQASAVALATGRRVQPVMSEANRRAVSERQSLHNSGGRCKWFEVDGQRVQGTWERDVATKLTSLGIEWVKLGKKKDVVWYTMDGKAKAYTPDFYLPQFDRLLEVKGFWWGRDQEKMKLVCEQNQHLRIILMEKTMFESFLKDDVDLEKVDLYRP